MCIKYKWSVYGYHRLPSLKKDVVLYTTKQFLKPPSPKKEDTFHWSTCIYAFIIYYVMKYRKILIKYNAYISQPCKYIISCIFTAVFSHNKSSLFYFIKHISDSDFLFTFP